MLSAMSQATLSSQTEVWPVGSTTKATVTRTYQPTMSTPRSSTAAIRRRPMPPLAAAITSDAGATAGTDARATMGRFSEANCGHRAAGRMRLDFGRLGRSLAEGSVAYRWPMTTQGRWLAAWLGKALATIVLGPGVAVIGDPGVRLRREEAIGLVAALVIVGALLK
jgi:hypothetical protein